MILMGLATALFPGTLRTIVQVILGELIIAVCIVDCYCQIYLLSPLSPKLLSAVLQTDFREAREFLSFFVGYDVLRQWRITSLLILALLFPVSYLLMPGIRLHRRTGKARYLLLGLFITVFVCELPHALQFGRQMLSNNDQKSTEELIFRAGHHTMFTPLHRLAYSWHVANLSGITLQRIKNATTKATVDSCTHLSPHIVLVIGESYNKHHASLYGYRLETTPFQQQREKEGNLFVFADAVTPWNITSNVFLDLFSTWSHGKDGEFSTYPLFPVLFRRAGYDVRFFSNQYPLDGLHKGPTNQAGHFFLSDMELSDTLFDYRSSRAARYDMGLVRQVADYQDKHPEIPFTFDIIHLIGQHVDCSKRYPHQLGTFSQRDYANTGKNKKDVSAIMHYDNATRYNDMVVDSIMRLYEEEEAIVVYVADHGDEVYDDLPVRGRLFKKPTKQTARQEFEVPMWIWCSPKYLRLHQELVRRLEENRRQAFFTSDISQLLFHLAGIRCVWYDERRDILSTRYEGSPRIIAGEVDYDSLF